MAHESSVRAGSGVSVLREGLVPGYPQALPGMRGTNNVVINYEDIQSKLGVVQSSGLTVAGDAVHLSGPLTRLGGRRELIIQNLGAGALFIGGAGVTAANGVQVASGDLLRLDVLDVGDIYGISGAVSDVRILELK